ANGSAAEPDVGPPATPNRWLPGDRAGHRDRDGHRYRKLDAARAGWL
ncbi:MAG: hypothetical protein AVDCRST_MAG73-2408, partial [uncultured Thermomicrobiales bacterium]